MSSVPMRWKQLLVPTAAAAVAAFAFVSGCGGGTGLASRRDSGASIIMADCTWPSCVTDLLSTCVPSGKCTANIDRIAGAITTCYANGVTVRRAANTTWSGLETCKKGDAVSYSIETGTQFVDGIPAGMAFTIKDGSGAAVATGALSDSSGLLVTCSTGPTFGLPATCSLPTSDAARPDSGAAPELCTSPGTCPP